MTELQTITRLYSMEGATHLYSSEPAMLTPADLYIAQDDPAILAQLQNCNVYLITRRPRIYLNASNFSFVGDTIVGEFWVRRSTELASVPFRYKIRPGTNPSDSKIIDLAVNTNGTSMLVITADGERHIPVNVIIAEADSDLIAEDTDLDVLYVGQGIGRKHSRTALDRLLSHTTFQRILAETSAFFPDFEVLVLLYRFEHGRTIISNGGDFNVEPEASDYQDSLHLDKLRKTSLRRHHIVSLAEAALINYFKPKYNQLLKSTSFSASRKIKVVEQLLNTGITGLIVEICTLNLRSRVGTYNATPKGLDEILPKDWIDGKNLEAQDKPEWIEYVMRMLHTHYIHNALTTPSERESFLHGIVFNGETKRFNPWGV